MMAEKQGDTVAHVEADEQANRRPSLHQQVGDAQLANLSEHEATVRGALRAYPGAVIWSLVVLMSIIMEGYDTILVIP
jgi:hypothetical protein